MPISIEGKRVVVTGGARGIGEASVRALAAEGARVVSFDVLDDAGRRVAEEANAAGPGSVAYRHVDVVQRADVAEGVDWAVRELGGLDAVLNVAGIERRSPLQDLEESELDDVLAVNVKGTFFMCQSSFPHLRENGGSIVNFGSDAGLTPYPTGAHYSASKGAVMAFSRTAAAEWGVHRIRVNSVVPAIRTPMYIEYRERLTTEELAAHDAKLAEKIPIGGKLGDPTADLAPVLVFLVSDASHFITGQIISVNGGNGMVR